MTLVTDLDEHEHDRDTFIGANGEEELRDPWVVEGDEVLRGTHLGSVCVHGGASLLIPAGGQHKGSMWLRPGARVEIAGRHSGSLHVRAGSEVTVSGQQSGSIHVDAGGVVRSTPTGRLAGSIHGSGLIENAGVRGGSLHLSGEGQVRDLEGGRVKDPEIGPGGRSVYNW